MTRAFLGLGDLVLKDKEGRQPHAGRLDFLLQDPSSSFFWVEASLTQSEETASRLAAAGLNLMPYKWGKYRIRLTKADLAKQEPLISSLLTTAYDNRGA